MCCRYYILPKSVEWDPIREGAEHALVMRRFLEAGAALVSSGEVRPTDVVPVLATDRRGGKSCFPMRWGFRLEGPKPTLLINARAESAAEKPTFREAWASHRCAVPASGYYEWEHSPENSRGKGTKYAIADAGKELLWLCGLYRIENGLPVFVILTREPGPSLLRLHDRMPLILPAEAALDWIDPAVRPESLLSLARTDLSAEKAG